MTFPWGVLTSLMSQEIPYRQDVPGVIAPAWVRVQSPHSLGSLTELANWDIPTLSQHHSPAVTLGPHRWPASPGLLDRRGYRDSSLLAGLSESSELKNSGRDALNSPPQSPGEKPKWSVLRPPSNRRKKNQWTHVASSSGPTLPLG